MIHLARVPAPIAVAILCSACRGWGVTAAGACDACEGSGRQASEVAPHVQ